MESKILEIASGDEVKMNRMQEISSWFATKDNLYEVTCLIC